MRIDSYFWQWFWFKTRLKKLSVWDCRFQDMQLLSYSLSFQPLCSLMLAVYSLSKTRQPHTMWDLSNNKEFTWLHSIFLLKNGNSFLFLTVDLIQNKTVKTFRLRLLYFYSKTENIFLFLKVDLIQNKTKNLSGWDWWFQEMCGLSFWPLSSLMLAV